MLPWKRRQPNPPNDFPGWLVIGVLAFIAFMTIVCVIAEVRG